MLAFLLLVACYSDGDFYREGAWVRVRTPPGVQGYECWAYGAIDAPIKGGPECFPVEP
jgi:hypothetical protein